MRLLFILLVCVNLLAGGCADRRTAKEAFDNADYSTAYELFKPRAEAGDDEAQNYLGVHYFLGLGVKRDLHKALQWYEKAAIQGNPEAQFNYGLMFHNAYGTEHNMTNAFKWYYASYRQGNRNAELYMNSLADDNLLSPNQIDYAKLQAKQYIANPVVTEHGSEGTLFRNRLQTGSVQ